MPTPNLTTIKLVTTPVADNLDRASLIEYRWYQVHAAKAPRLSVACATPQQAEAVRTLMRRHESSPFKSGNMQNNTINNMRLPLLLVGKTALIEAQIHPMQGTRIHPQ
jgi:hypothetical protein